MYHDTFLMVTDCVSWEALENIRMTSKYSRGNSQQVFPFFYSSHSLEDIQGNVSS